MRSLSRAALITCVVIASSDYDNVQATMADSAWSSDAFLLGDVETGPVAAEESVAPVVTAVASE